MVTFKNYVAGWLMSSITEFVPTLPKTSQTLKYAMLTSLDSDVDIASLLDSSPALRRLKKSAVVLGKAVIFPTKTIQPNATDLFCGFDEVWFFPKKPTEEKPNSFWLVGPEKPTKSEMSKIGAWMDRNECSLGLGDGVGLNFVIKAHGLVRYLLGHSIEQELPEGMHLLFEEDSVSQ